MNTRKWLFTAFGLIAFVTLALALPAHADNWICYECGYTGNHDSFCGMCGLSRIENDALQSGTQSSGTSGGSWVCSSCGHTDNNYNFCGICGLSRTENNSHNGATQTVQPTSVPRYVTRSTPAVQSTPVPTPNNRPLFRIEIDVGSGNVRNAPSFGGEKIGVVVARERFDVFEVVHDANNCFWYRIKLGWIHSGITTLKVPDLTQSYGSTPAPTAPRY